MQAASAVGVLATLLLWPGFPAAALASATAVVHSAALVSPSSPWFSHVSPSCVRRW